nr:methyltransferase domain-containing protein [Nocardia sp. CC227C]
MRCPRGHSFDLAKQGYVSLLTGSSTKMTGDTPAMLEARAAFQTAGHFAPIAAVVAGAVEMSIRPRPPAARPAPPGGSIAGDPADSASPRLARPGTARMASTARLVATLLPDATPRDIARGGRANPAVPTRRNGPSTAVLEVGAGTGYYLGAVLDAVPAARGIAMDVSKPAVRRCARAHGRAAAVLADAWRGLPVRDEVLDAVLCVFAPRNADEVARVLAPEGRFVVVTPTERHLGELIEPLRMVRVDADKQDRLTESLSARFELLERTQVEYAMTLGHADIRHVVQMGPSAFHAADTRAERIATLPEPYPVTASVTVSIYRPRA